MPDNTNTNSKIQTMKAHIYIYANIVKLMFFSQFHSFILFYKITVTRLVCLKVLRTLYAFNFQLKNCRLRIFNKHEVETSFTYYISSTSA